MENLKSIFWMKKLKSPNPVGILVVSWIIAVILGVTLEDGIRVEYSMWAGTIGTIASTLSFLYVIYRNKKQS